MTAATADCIRRVRRALPPAAFQHNPRRLRAGAVHTAVIFAGYLTIRQFPLLRPLLAIVIGHSLACLAFVAHELSHNAVVRHPRVRYLLSLWAFGINAIPPTMWNRLHNDAHHHHAGTAQDPDRPFLDTERSPASSWYATVFYPSRGTWRANVLVFVHFVTYIARNIAAVYYGGDAKPTIMTSKPAYRRGERLRIAAELVAIAALQYGIWIVAGRSVAAYLWASPAALCVASAVLMAYVFTNHFLNPITHEHDPLAGTTSVIVPRVFDILHGNFSYHTEHHLFPSLNSDYYPLVSAALREAAPDGYQQIPIGEAWRRLWEQEQFRRLAPGRTVER